MQQDRSKSVMWQALAYAWQFGYTIVIPLVLFAVGGRLLDRYFGTGPWLFLAGIVLAVIISTVGLILKALRIFREISSNNNRPTPPPDKKNVP